MVNDPPLHPLCRPVAFLLGVWQGSGTGVYPTIEPFRYEERSVFTHSGKPFLAYAQETWAIDGTPLHRESGFIRPQGDGEIELVVAHNFGVVEVSLGAVTDEGLSLTARDLIATPGAKPVEALQRHFAVSGSRLVYEVAMAAAGQPLQGHLEASLEKVS